MWKFSVFIILLQNFLVPQYFTRYASFIISSSYQFNFLKYRKLNSSSFIWKKHSCVFLLIEQLNKISFKLRLSEVHKNLWKPFPYSRTLISMLSYVLTMSNWKYASSKNETKLVIWSVHQNPSLYFRLINVEFLTVICIV